MSEPFDFESFISGAQLARTTVSAFKVDNTREIERLKEAYNELAEVIRSNDEGGDPREGVSDPTSTAMSDLAQRIDTLRGDMERSRIEFVIRTLTPEEYASIREGDDDVFAQFALQSVSPELTVDQVKRVTEVVGAMQWGEMMSEANALILSRAAVPDFSPANSQSPSMRAS